MLTGGGLEEGEVSRLRCDSLFGGRWLVKPGRGDKAHHSGRDLGTLPLWGRWLWLGVSRQKEEGHPAVGLAD